MFRFFKLLDSDLAFFDNLVYSYLAFRGKFKKGASAKAIARHLGVDRTRTLTDALRKLKELGLVEHSDGEWRAVRPEGDNERLFRQPDKLAIKPFWGDRLQFVCPLFLARQKRPGRLTVKQASILCLCRHLEARKQKRFVTPGFVAKRLRIDRKTARAGIAAFRAVFAFNQFFQVKNETQDATKPKAINLPLQKKTLSEAQDRLRRNKLAFSQEKMDDLLEKATRRFDSLKQKYDDYAGDLGSNFLKVIDEAIDTQVRERQRIDNLIGLNVEEANRKTPTDKFVSDAELNWVVTNTYGDNRLQVLKPHHDVIPVRKWWNGLLSEFGFETIDSLLRGIPADANLNRYKFEALLRNGSTDSKEVASLNGQLTS